MRRHFSAETLALHREGAVSAREAANITAHLAECSLCSAIDAQFADLSSVLSGTQMPPMPQAVQARIQMAIASESAVRGAASPGGARAASAAADNAVTRQAEELRPAQTPGRPDLPERRRRWFPRLQMPDWSSPLMLRGLAAAGAVVVIAGAGMLFANARSGTSSAGAGAPGAPAKRSQASRSTAAGTHLANGSQAGRPVGVNYRLNGKVATTTALVSDSNFNKHSLPAAVRQDVASFPRMSNAALRAQPQASAAAASLPGAFNISRLESCLDTVASGRMVLLTEVARYLDTPAAIIVLRSANARVLDLVVVRPACSAANPAIITTLTVPAG